MSQDHGTPERRAVDPTREQLAGLIAARMAQELDRLSADFRKPNGINACVLDDLLPEEIALRIFEAFPAQGRMRFNNTLRERKHVAAQMDRYDPILEEAIYAFQDARVVETVARITRLRALEPDEHLYAGGISVMSRGHFLNPHLDNSHDKDRERYRVLNLLYYVTPDWKPENGGNLELWDDGPKGRPREIVSRFNRLVLMITNRNSWHSVNRVKSDGRRCCVSNYYFSRYPADDRSYFHVTTFRGRPEQPLRDAVLRIDGRVRMAMRKHFPALLGETSHLYKKTPRDRR